MKSSGAGAGFKLVSGGVFQRRTRSMPRLPERSDDDEEELIIHSNLDACQALQGANTDDDMKKSLSFIQT
jgi:hypothetical protein